EPSVRRHWLHDREVERAVGGGQDAHRVALLELARDDPLRQRRLDALADHALQRPRAEHGVVADQRELLHRLRRHVERDAAVVEAALQEAELDASDLRYLLPVERVEDDDVVDAVEELGPEDRKSTRLNSSHVKISYAVFCLKKKN